MSKKWVPYLGVWVICGAAIAAPPGTLDGKNIPSDYADATTLGVQTNRTGFGDQDVTTQPILSEGSELNAIYIAQNTGGSPPTLNIGLAGNLRDIGNAFAIFIDTSEFGQTELQTEGVDGPPWTLQQNGRIVTVNTNGTPGDPSDDTSSIVPNSGMLLPDCGLGGGFTGWDFVAVVDAFSGGTNINEYLLFDFDVSTTGTANCIYDPNVGQVPCDPTPGNPADDIMLRASREGVGGTSLNTGTPTGFAASNYTIGFVNTNTSGVTSTGVSMAAMSTSGVEIAIPLARINFLGTFGGNQFRVLVVALDGDEFGNTQFSQGFGTVLNQILPPIDGGGGTCGSPTALGNRPDLSALSCISADITTLGLFTGSAEGFIDPAEYGLTAPNETQICPTDYGDQFVATIGLVPANGGSELNVMSATNDDTFLYLAFTGNLEPNGNSINIFIDADSNGDVGEHVIDFGGAGGIGPQIGGMSGVELPNSSSNGLPRTDDLPVQYNVAYGMNASGTTVFVDFYDLVNDTFAFRGQVTSGSNDATLQEGSNPNGLLAGVTNINSAGVIGCGDGSPCFLETPDEVAARARTAVLGFEMAIPLADLGLSASDLPREIRIFTHVGNGDGGFASDQGLPSMRNQSAAGSQVSNFGGASNFTDPFNVTDTLAYEARAADYCLETVAGDADCDGDNDLADVQLIQLCVEDDMPSVTLPRLPLPLECERLDRNGDNRVTDADLGDLTALIDASGPQ